MRTMAALSTLNLLAPTMSENLRDNLKMCNLWTHSRNTVLLSVTILPNVTLLQERLFEKAQRIFVHNQVEIIGGCRVLGSVRGSDNAEKKFVEKSNKQQKSSLKKLVIMLMFHLKVFITRSFRRFSVS